MANVRAESLISTIKAVGEFILMVCGIIGIAVEIFHEQGLLRRLLDQLMNTALSNSLLVILASGFVLLAGKVWYDNVFSRAEHINALGNFMMRALMFAGAYFLYLYITTGSFKL